MKMKYDCVKCILNQIDRIAKYSELEPELKKRACDSSRELSEAIDHFNQLPPLYSELIYNEFFSVSGVTDPYKKLRKEQNDLILKRQEFFRSLIKNSEDPVFTSLHFSLLGNVIDYGGIELFDFEETFKLELDAEPDLNDFPVLNQNFCDGMKLLVIADNAGESVFDKFFLEQLKIKFPKSTLFYGVKSGPAINDVLKEDALYIGIDEYADIIETGSTYAGTVISKCDPDFVDLFNNCDIVISKGQGNYETLEIERGRKIFFVFKVKCDVVADHTLLKKNSMIMAFNDSLSRHHKLHSRS